MLITASGTDDLQPDADGGLTDGSRLRDRPRGFAHIGIPVRQTIEATGVDAAFVYLSNVVYGPGKAYTDTIVAGLRTGRTKVIGAGGNRLPLTHVADAAGAITHLAGTARGALVGRSFLAVPPTPVTQRQFLDTTADALGVARPGSVPAFAAAAVAGRINAEVMTLDALARPRALEQTGFRFRFDGLRTGIADALTAIDTGRPAHTA